jgi:hypothetical protein
MDTSTTHTKDLRSKIGKIAIAIAFAIVVCGVVARPAMADRDDHHRRGRQHQKWHHHDRHEQRPDVIYNYASSPYVYYAPPPVVYVPAPPPPGINLFFRIP